MGAGLQSGFLAVYCGPQARCGGIETYCLSLRATQDRGSDCVRIFFGKNCPADEVSGLMELLAMALSKEVSELKRDGVQLHFVGARDSLSDRVKNGFENAETCTAENTTLVLNVCFNYGGRWDMVQAAKRLCQAGLPITEDSIAGAMSLSHCPDPDLIIRTGGEMRISNFLLWQAAYSELYFSDLLWPDFDELALDTALHEYASPAAAVLAKRRISLP